MMDQETLRAVARFLRESSDIPADVEAYFPAHAVRAMFHKAADLIEAGQLESHPPVIRPPGTKLEA